MQHSPTPLSAGPDQEAAHSASSLTSMVNHSERLAHLLDILPSGIVVLDGQGRVSEVNQVAIDMLGEPLLGERWREIIDRAFAPRADDGHEVSLHDGRLIKVELRALEQQPGQLIVLTDLTETRRLQSRMAHMQRLSSLGRMVASLAHQVRTPLSAAMLYAANLGNQTLGNDARVRFHGKLMSRLQELEHQVSDMLLFARSGDQLPMVKVTADDLAELVCNSTEGVLARFKAELSVQLESSPAQILANASTLVSAIGNLVHNAAQVGADRIQLQVTNDHESMQIVVSDNGPGIAETLRQKIFEPFYTTHPQGTGLGLSVVQAVVTNHRGRLSVESTEGQGASFILTLPLAERGDEFPEPSYAFGG